MDGEKDCQLRSLQLRITQVCQEVHKICVTNNIRYSMIGGTLIGALRHKGFIPWDDDIDIAMPYDDYVRFKDLVFRTKHEWLTFDLAGYSEDYFSPFIKAYDSRTTFAEHGRQKTKPRGVFIDIFPLTYVGNCKLRAIWELRKHKTWRDLLTRRNYVHGMGLFVLVEWIYIFLSRFFSAEYLIKKINEQHEELNKKRTYYISDLDGTMAGIVPSRLFDEFCLYDFEGYKFYGMKNADEYLRLVFGDYMKLPPEEKRIPHHIEYMDLNKSYLDE